MTRKTRAQQSPVDLAIANMPARRPRRWWERVDTAHQQIMDELAAAWFSGRLGSELKPASEAIARTLAELGVVEISFQGVQKWLQGLQRKA